MIDDDQHAQLTHFNLSFFVDDSGAKATDGSAYVAFSRWMAPELLSASISRPNYATDVYALSATTNPHVARSRPRRREMGSSGSNGERRIVGE